MGSSFSDALARTQGPCSTAIPLPCSTVMIFWCNLSAVITISQPADSSGLNQSLSKPVFFNPITWVKPGRNWDEQPLHLPLLLRYCVGFQGGTSRAPLNASVEQPLTPAHRENFNDSLHPSTCSLQWEQSKSWQYPKAERIAGQRTSYKWCSKVAISQRDISGRRINTLCRSKENGSVTAIIRYLMRLSQAVCGILLLAGGARSSPIRMRGAINNYSVPLAYPVNQKISPTWYVFLLLPRPVLRSRERRFGECREWRLLRAG